MKQRDVPPLLLLSRFSRVRLCATPETAAHQAPPSLRFSRQEHWSGVPFPSLLDPNPNWSELTPFCVCKLNFPNSISISISLYLCLHRHQARTVKSWVRAGEVLISVLFLSPSAFTTFLQEAQFTPAPFLLVSRNLF